MKKSNRKFKSLWKEAYAIVSEQSHYYHEGIQTNSISMLRAFKAQFSNHSLHHAREISSLHQTHEAVGCPIKQGPNNNQVIRFVTVLI